MSSSKHVVPVKTYALIFACLLALTATTVFVAFQELGALNNVVALGIAVTKGVLVVLFFMHLRSSTRLTKIVILSGFLWFLILVGLTLSDYTTRGLLGVPGGK
jgi:cytochrome c oxidase subunit 4